MATAMMKKPTFSAMMSSDGYQKLINSTIKEPDRRNRFVTSITSAVATNPALQECEPSTILSAALLGESLKLSPSPQLGQFYMVPFKDRKNGRTVATYVTGYHGLIQLALRSGFYKSLNVISVKEGELISYNPLSEDIELKLIEDEEEREKAKTIGYCAYFEYLNGFKKTIYWSKAKMENHALRYSKGYAAKKGYTFWEKDFDAMAHKTMLRQILTKWGMMSVEMENAIQMDNSVIKANDDDVFVVDTPATQLEQAVEEEPAPAQTIAVDDDTGEVISLDDL